MGWGNLDIRSDLGDLTDGWLVDEEGLVDFVQEEFVVDSVVSVVLTSSEDWAAVSVEGWVGFSIGVWEDGPWHVGGSSVDSMAENLVQVLFNGDVSLAVVTWGVDVVLDIVVVPGVVLVVGVTRVVLVVVVEISLRGVGHVLGDDLNLENIVKFEKVLEIMTHYEY